MNRIHSSSLSPLATSSGIMPLESSKSGDIIVLESLPPEPESSGVSREQSTLGLSETESTEVNGFSLPPVDGGFGAWSFLASAVIVEAITWGIPDTYGVFLQRYLENEKFASQPHAGTLLPLVGTLASGIMYCTGPIVYPYTGRYPSHRRIALWLGMALCVIALVGASFTTDVRALVALQGVLYGIGASLLYAPCISFMAEWFVARRGLANGTIFCGTAVGGLILPIVQPKLISAYGTSATLRILGIAMAVILVPLLPFLKGRLPNIRQTHGPTPRPKHSLLSFGFIMLMLVNTLQSLAYFVPLVWLPTFASELNIGNSKNSLVLSVLNSASLFSRLGLGYLSDKADSWFLAFASTFSSCIIVFLLWGVASTTLGGLIAFGLIFGFCGCGWACLWTGLMRDLTKDDHLLAISMFGYLNFSRGIGSIVSTPITTAFQHGHSLVRTTHVKVGFDVAGGRFREVIIYTGLCFAAGSAVTLYGWVFGFEGKPFTVKRGFLHIWRLQNTMA